MSASPYLRRLSATVTDSISLRVLLAGIGLILLGAILQHGVWAGLVGILGFFAVTFGAGGYVLVWLFKRR